MKSAKYVRSLRKPYGGIGSGKPPQGLHTRIGPLDTSLPPPSQPVADAQNLVMIGGVVAVAGVIAGAYIVHQCYSTDSSSFF